MKVRRRRREDRLQWLVECAEEMLLHGERGDGDVSRGVRIGVVANKAYRRYHLTDEEALALARRAFDQLEAEGCAELRDASFHATPRLRARDPHPRGVVLPARTWRALGYSIPGFVPDGRNLKNVREDKGVVTFQNAWD